MRCEMPVLRNSKLSLSRFKDLENLKKKKKIQKQIEVKRIKRATGKSKIRQKKIYIPYTKVIIFMHTHTRTHTQ